MVTRILGIWLPNWPIQRILRDQPELKNRPLALYETGSRGGLKIAFVSTSAKKRGIEPNIPVADAIARLGKQLQLVQHNPLADINKLTELAERCESFSPIVGFCKNASDKNEDTFYLNITGIGRLFGNEKELAQKVWQAFRNWGYSARLAITSNSGSAWALCHFDKRAVQQPFIAEQDADDLLQPLPLAGLRLSEKTLTELLELGLKTIGDVLALPRESLASRLPAELSYRLDQACGQIAEPIQPIQPVKDFIATWDFFYPTPKKEAVFSVLRQLTDRLVSQLQEVNHGVLEIVCKFTCEPKATISQSIGFYRCSANAKHIFELLQLKFEHLRLPASVANISLQATRTSLLNPRQRELFENESKEHSDEFAILINQLTGRLGETAVTQPLLCANAQPERAFREQPMIARLDGQNRSGVLLPTEKKRSTSTRSQRSPFLPLERPTRLLEQPVPIQVTAPDGPPQCFAWSQQIHFIQRRFGPERIETSWWGKQGIRRDYYRVETENGAWYWIFRSLSSGRWFLHGEFA